MKNLIKQIPVLGSLIVSIKNKIMPPKVAEKFTSSQEYWETRYRKGGNSGAGSYNNLAEFKAEVVNSFVAENNIETVIELGFGDGNQLSYFQFESYIGFDVSDTVIKNCSEKFKNDPSKEFLNMNAISNQQAKMTMSLDVIYHLIEDEVYNNYMNHLFALSTKYVIIYACDSDNSENYEPHVKTRKFTQWIEQNRTDFKLINHIPNKYPFDKNKPKTTSFADFYIYQKI